MLRAGGLRMLLITVSEATMSTESLKYLAIFCLAGTARADRMEVISGMVSRWFASPVNHEAFTTCTEHLDILFASGFVH